MGAGRAPVELIAAVGVVEDGVGAEAGAVGAEEDGVEATGE